MKLKRVPNSVQKQVLANAEDQAKQEEECGARQGGGAVETAAFEGLRQQEPPQHHGHRAHAKDRQIKPGADQERGEEAPEAVGGFGLDPERQAQTHAELAEEKDEGKWQEPGA
jgi:hypothetical protein